MLALQEVDQYDEFWAPWLRKRGYGGVWKCRTSLTAQKKDGCGLFFKLDKFDLLAKREIEYNDIAFGRPVGYDATTTDDSAGGGDGGDGPEKIPLTEESKQTYVRDCVGVLALLRAKTNQSQPSSSSAAAADEESSRTVLVASTHLFWDPRHADVKLAQADRLLAEAGKFLEDNKVRFISQSRFAQHLTKKKKKRATTVVARGEMKEEGSEGIIKLYRT